MAVAADAQDVAALDVGVGLAVEMGARVARFGDEDVDFAGVGHGNRAVGHRLRANGHEGEGAQAGLQNRPARRQSVGGRTGGRGDDKAVRTLGVDELAVDKGFKLDHLPRAAARNHHVVERERLLHAFSFAYQVGFQQDALFGQVFAGEHTADLLQHFFARHLGKKAQMSLVDADQRDAERGGFAGGGEKSAVAAQHDNQAAFAADVVLVRYAALCQIFRPNHAAFDAFAIDEHFDFFRQKKAEQIVQTLFNLRRLRAGDDADAFEFGNHGLGGDGWTGWRAIMARLEAV